MKIRKASLVASSIVLICGCVSLEDRLGSPDSQVRAKAEEELYQVTRKAPIEERLATIDKLTRKDLLLLIAMKPVGENEREGCKAAEKITVDEDCLRLALEASTVAVQECSTKHIFSQEHLQTVFSRSSVDSVRVIALDRMSAESISRLPYDPLLARRWVDVKDENVLTMILADVRNGLAEKDRIAGLGRVSKVENLCKIMKQVPINDFPEMQAVIVKRLQGIGRLHEVDHEIIRAFVCSKADFATRILALESLGKSEQLLAVIRDSIETNILTRACQLVNDADAVGKVVLMRDCDIAKLNAYICVYGSTLRLKDLIENHSNLITSEVESLIKAKTTDQEIMAALENLKRRREAEKVCASLIEGEQGLLIDKDKFKLIQQMGAMDPPTRGAICRKVMEKTDWLRNLTVSAAVCAQHRVDYPRWYKKNWYMNDQEATLLHLRPMLVRMLSEKDQREVMNRILSFSNWLEPYITSREQAYRLGLTSGLTSQDIIKQLLCSKMTWHSEWEASSSWISPKWGNTTEPGGGSYIGCENSFKSSLIRNASEELLVQIVKEYSLKKEDIVAGYPDSFRDVMAKIKDPRNVQELVAFFDANKGKGRIGRKILGIEYSTLIAKLGKDAIHERYVELIGRQKKEGRLTFEGFYPRMSPEDFMVVCKERGVGPERELRYLGMAIDRYVEQLKFSRRVRYSLLEKEDHEFMVSFMTKYVYPLNGTGIADVAKNLLANDLKRECHGDDWWVVYKSMKYKTMLRFNERTGEFILEEFTGE